MSQSAGHLLMVRPAAFGYNRETAPSNGFQHQPAGDVSEAALKQFNTVVDRIQGRGIRVVVVEDSKNNPSPDSVFPNNWVTFHPDGTIFLFPMASLKRRTERRREVLDLVTEATGYNMKLLTDLSPYEKEGKFLEGTGSMVFDHINKHVYMSRSRRSSETVLNDFCQRTGYLPVVFNSNLFNGIPVYHTNVLLSIGTSVAVICPGAIAPEARPQILAQLEQSGRTLITITPEEMGAFCANILEVKDASGSPVFLISEHAIQSMHPARLRKLEQAADLLACDVSVIEEVGGGSIRCMAAEVFWEKSNRTVKVIEVTDTVTAERCYALRWSVLRAPWGKPKGSEMDELDGKVFLTAALSEKGEITGTARLQTAGAGTAQIRYMAVDPAWQGKGVGKALIARLESEALQTGHTEIILQARENAVPFYRSSGYTVVEKTFLLYDSIQHFLMKKLLK
ncbi:MAG TPA: GNAT family N-acetyltransferase [Bacteroidia bacterium]|nr:GNAT family N-acetyltransferase [Bacteroidia bacterium]